MTETLTTAATVYRKKRGAMEWMVLKPEPKTPGELPKGPVRRGESSVGAILRILREDRGLTVEVMEESGRFVRGGEKIIYYLIESTNGETPRSKEIQKQEKWGQYAQIAKTVSSDKEKKMLSQAKKVLKELQKVKKN